MGAQGRRTIVVIDDAHRLRSDTLENLKTFKEKGVSILLAAHTQLAKKLDLSYLICLIMKRPDFGRLSIKKSKLA